MVQCQGEKLFWPLAKKRGSKTRFQNVTATSLRYRQELAGRILAGTPLMLILSRLVSAFPNTLTVGRVDQRGSFHLVGQRGVASPTVRSKLWRSSWSHCIIIEPGLSGAENV
jgi:hypothetical protein